VHQRADPIVEDLSVRFTSQKKALSTGEANKHPSSFEERPRRVQRSAQTRSVLRTAQQRRLIGVQRKDLQSLKRNSLLNLSFFSSGRHRAIEILLKTTIKD